MKEEQGEQSVCDVKLIEPQEGIEDVWSRVKMAQRAASSPVHVLGWDRPPFSFQQSK